MPSMDRLPSERFFLKEARHISSLRRWLCGRRYNSLSMGHQDKNGNSMIGLSWDYKPDSDWSKWDPRGLVIVLDKALYDDALKTIEEGRAS